MKKEFAVIMAMMAMTACLMSCGKKEVVTEEPKEDTVIKMELPTDEPSAAPEVEAEGEVEAVYYEPQVIDFTDGSSHKEVVGRELEGNEEAEARKMLDADEVSRIKLGLLSENARGEYPSGNPDGTSRAYLIDIVNTTQGTDVFEVYLASYGDVIVKTPEDKLVLIEAPIIDYDGQNTGTYKISDYDGDGSNELMIKSYASYGPEYLHEGLYILDYSYMDAKWHVYHLYTDLVAEEAAKFFKVSYVDDNKAAYFLNDEEIGTMELEGKNKDYDLIMDSVMLVSDWENSFSVLIQPKLGEHGIVNAKYPNDYLVLHMNYEGDGVWKTTDCTIAERPGGLRSNDVTTMYKCYFKILEDGFGLDAPLRAVVDKGVSLGYADWDCEYEGKELSIDELIEVIGSRRNVPGTKAPELYYSFLNTDFGPFFAIQFRGVGIDGADDDSTTVVILSYVNEKLHISHCFNTWSRSSGEFKDNGYIYRQGASSACESGINAGFIGFDGQYTELYYIDRYRGCFDDMNVFYQVYSEGSPEMYVDIYDIGDDKGLYTYNYDDGRTEKTDLDGLYVYYTKQKGTNWKTMDTIKDLLSKRYEKLGVSETIETAGKDIEWIPRY